MPAFYVALTLVLSAHTSDVILCQAGEVRGLNHSKSYNSGESHACPSGISEHLGAIYHLD